MRHHDITKLIQIKDPQLQIDAIEQEGNHVTIFVSRERQAHACPQCQTKTTRVHDYRTRTIKHAALNGVETRLKYRRRRYVCPTCHTRFPETNTMVLPYEKISLFSKHMILHEYRNTQAFGDIAKRLHISASTVIRHTNKHINPRRLKLPEVLAIDEFKNLRSGTGKYACVLADPINKKTIDVLPDRRYHHLIQYFSRIPLEERNQVKIVTSDLWESYRKLVKRAFPNAILVADTFHFLRHLLWGFNDVRIRVMNAQPKDSYEYYLLKKHWKILTKYYGDLSYKHFYDHRLRYHITPQEIRFKAEAIHPDLKTALDMKDAFYEALRGMDEHEARDFLPDYIRRLKKTKIKELRTFSRTLENWFDEIIHSFRCVNQETGEILRPHYSNAIIEGMNNKIKVIKRVSYGYRNFENFRRRIMTSFNDLMIQS